MGPPGSGKGTQVKFLSQKTGLPYICLGDLLREMIHNNDEEGALIESHMLNGGLVPPEVVNKIIHKYLSIDKYNNGCIFDGYPRSVEQANFLKQISPHKIRVIYFEIPDDLVISRILARFSCNDCGKIYNSLFVNTKVDGVCDICGSHDFTKRKDDNIDIIVSRLQTYKIETKQLLDFYLKTGDVNMIDASMTPSKIEIEILSMLKMI